MANGRRRSIRRLVDPQVFAGHPKILCLWVISTRCHHEAHTAIDGIRGQHAADSGESWVSGTIAQSFCMLYLRTNALLIA